MNDQHVFADVDLPFHVWVRESGRRGFAWVLREASHLQPQVAVAPLSTGKETPPAAGAGS